MNIKKILREEIGEFEWIEDTNPYEEINLKDEAHVNTIKIGDRLIITGVGDDMVFNNSEGNVISIGTFRGKSDAWINQVLISFDEPIYSYTDTWKPNWESSDFSDEYVLATHCGGKFKQECNCKEEDYGDEQSGTCWWVAVPLLEKVVKINVGT
jgi:hypothetical protein